MRLAILGASGHGKVVADIAETCGWDQVEFYDDAWPEIKNNGSWPVKGNSQRLLENMSQYAGIFVAIGNNSIRAEKLSWLDDYNASVISLYHPSAVVSQYAHIGSGTVVMPGVIVNADTSVAEGCILNTGCSVDHDCTLDRCVHISPGARLAGGVSVGEYSWIGIGASVRQQVNIGKEVTVGAGAAVVSDLPDMVTAVGVPAKAI